METVVLVLLACAIWFTIGCFLGMRICSHRNHCIRKQRRDVADWTGEITRAMQERLAKRERQRAGGKDNVPVPTSSEDAKTPVLPRGVMLKPFRKPPDDPTKT
jgi:hypothetical protein